jgi:hypothetical protein
MLDAKILTQAEISAAITLYLKRQGYECGAVEFRQVPGVRVTDDMAGDMQTTTDVQALVFNVTKLPARKTKKSEAASSDEREAMDVKLRAAILRHLPDAHRPGGDRDVLLRKLGWPPEAGSDLLDRFNETLDDLIVEGEVEITSAGGYRRKGKQP